MGGSQLRLSTVPGVLNIVLPIFIGTTRGGVDVGGLSPPNFFLFFNQLYNNNIKICWVLILVIFICGAPTPLKF